jgi:uncharacterized membrane protein
MKMAIFDNIKAFLKAVLWVFFPVLFASLSHHYTLVISAYISVICGLIALAIEILLTLIKGYRNPLLSSMGLRTSEWVSLALIVSDSLLLNIIPYFRRNVVVQPIFWIVLASMTAALFLAFLDAGLEGMLFYRRHQLMKKAKASLE